MNKYLLMTVGIVFSSVAQLLMKLASPQNLDGWRWYVPIAAALGCYMLAFLAYFFILRIFPLSVASPVMTVGVMLLVVVCGLLTGEEASLRKGIGLFLGVASVWLILGTEG